MPRAVTLEICADSVGACVAAESGGAQRIELCTGLVEGGTTPSAGTLALALERVKLPIVVLVRPRRGDFGYDDVEIETSLRDIAAAKRAGAHGIALGALDVNGSIDVATVTALVRAARPLPVTFHRAFDFVREPLAALDVLLSLGVERVLTAGGAADVFAGAERIAQLVAAAGGRCEVIAGGGVRAHGVRALVARTHVRAVHASARELVTSPVRHRPALALDTQSLPNPWERQATSAALVRGLADELERS